MDSQNYDVMPVPPFASWHCTSCIMMKSIKGGWFCAICKEYHSASQPITKIVYRKGKLLITDFVCDNSFDLAHDSGCVRCEKSSQIGNRFSIRLIGTGVIIHMMCCSTKCRVDMNSYFPSIPSGNNTCIVCGNRAENTCSGCKLTKYCSEKCQTIAWPGHKNYCINMNRCNSAIQGTLINRNDYDITLVENERVKLPTNCEIVCKLKEDLRKQIWLCRICNAYHGYEEPRKTWIYNYKGFLIYDSTCDEISKKDSQSRTFDAMRSAARCVKCGGKQNNNFIFVKNRTIFIHCSEECKLSTYKYCFPN